MGGRKAIGGTRRPGRSARFLPKRIAAGSRARHAGSVPIGCPAASPSILRVFPYSCRRCRARRRGSTEAQNPLGDNWRFASRFFMKRTWLLFAQAVTVLLAAFFVVATLKPEWLNRRTGPLNGLVSVVEAPAAPAGSIAA